MLAVGVVERRWWSSARLAWDRAAVSCGRCVGGVAPVCLARGSGGEGPAVVVGESEGGEALQVDGGGALADGDAVAFDAAVANLAVFVAHEPGEGAFDHRSVLTVGLDEGVGVGLPAGCGEESVVFVDTITRPRALVVHRARNGHVKQWVPNRAVRLRPIVTVTPAGQVTVRPRR